MDLKVDIGLCRFCSNEGIFSLNDTNANYSDIILECFNIFICISQPASSLICSECATHLNEAHSFRQKVLRAEQNLHKDVTVEVQQDMAPNPVNIKIEPEGPNTEFPNWITEDHVSDVTVPQMDTSQVYKFQRMDVFDIWFKHRSKRGTSERARCICEEMKNALLLQNKGKMNLLKFYNRVWYICKILVWKWKQANSNRSRFLKNNVDWLKASECIETVEVGDHNPSVLYVGVKDCS